MKTYPVNLVLENRLVILVGAKGEITRKLPNLLEAGAQVHVIAPNADPVVEKLDVAGDIEWIRRRYEYGDLAGAFVVFACTNDAAVHDEIWAEGLNNNQLVNVMDVIPQCNFHAASFMRRGQLTISIGTGGAAPALAATLRKRFQSEFGPEYAEFLDHAKSLRPLIARRIPNFRQRVKFWYDWVESDAIAHLRNGAREEFNSETAGLLEDHAARQELLIT
ncbi:MAG: bifunctional precorrin-2 dehydrogenase/sirohydrochlorin ferrochelatase [Chloroflexota bacterium]